MKSVTPPPVQSPFLSAALTTSTASKGPKRRSRLAFARPASHTCGSKATKPVPTATCRVDRDMDRPGHPAGTSSSHRHDMTLLGLSVIFCPFYAGLWQGWTQRGCSQGEGRWGLSCRPPQLRELTGARIQSLCAFSVVKALSLDSPLGAHWSPLDTRTSSSVR